MNFSSIGSIPSTSSAQSLLTVPSLQYLTRNRKFDAGRPG